MADEPVGFFSFTVHDDALAVSKLCTHPDFRCLSVGGTLHDDLVRIGMAYNKKRLEMWLHEDNKDRAFVIKRGWRATKVHRELFPNKRDGYLFVKEL